MKKKKERITCGDKLADWFFRKIIYALNREDVEIYVKKTLYGWEPKRIKRGKKEYKMKVKVSYCGESDSNEIYLNAAKSKHKNKDEMAKTLLHEALHVAFPRFLEQDVWHLENVIWQQLNKKQKLILKSYIPRHIVKN